MAIEWYSRFRGFNHPYPVLRTSELQAALSREFHEAGLVCLMPHFFTAERSSLDENPVHIGLLPIRCAFVSEDTPVIAGNLKQLQKVYRQSLQAVKERAAKVDSLDWWEVADELEYQSVDDGPGARGRNYVVESPLFNPWNLTGAFVWDLDVVPQQVLSELPSLVFDWPGYSSEIDTRHPICAAIDPWLLHMDRQNVIENLFKTSTGFRASWYANVSRSETAKSRYAEMELDARNLLLSWGILPDWVGASSASAMLTFTENGVNTFGWVNDVTTRWALRALQIAILRSSDVSDAPRLLLWDEPELGLHPLAMRKLVHEVIPSLVAEGFKIVTATHSITLASSADQLYEAVRDESALPDLVSVSKLDLGKLEELGFTSTDYLLSRKGFVVVEGKHDALVLEKLFEPYFEKSRKDILAVGGIGEVFKVREAELLLKLHQPICCVIDGADRSALETD